MSPARSERTHDSRPHHPQPDDPRHGDPLRLAEDTPGTPDLHVLRRAVRQASDPMLVMHRVVEQTLLLIPAAAGAAVELAETDHADHLTTVCGAGSLRHHVGGTVQLEDSLSGLAVRTGETLYASDCATDERVNREVCRRLGARSMICVPLRREQRPRGVLKVCARQPQAFGGAQSSILSMLGDFISATIGASWDIADAAGRLLVQTGAGSAPVPSDAPDADPLRGMYVDPVGKFVANVLCPDVANGLALKDRITRICAQRDFTIVGQPIVNTSTGAVLCVEALARFPGNPAASPEEIFRELEQVAAGHHCRVRDIPWDTLPRQDSCERGPTRP